MVSAKKERLLRGYTEENIEKWANRFRIDDFEPYLADDNGYPIMEKAEYEAESLYSFHKTSSALRYGADFSKKTAHFFSEWESEKMWRGYEGYLYQLKQFKGVISPIFRSRGLARPLIKFQTFRSRLLGQIMGEVLTVIPSVEWETPDTFDIVFNGVPKNSTIAFSSVGFDEYPELYQMGIDYMAETLKPKNFVVLGRKVKADYHGIEVNHFDIDFTEREKQQKAWKFRKTLFNPKRADEEEYPIMKAEDIIPKSMVGFNTLMSTKVDRDVCTHFCIEDYQFERVWNGNYEEVITDIALTPDFSICENFSLVLCEFQTFRNRLLGQIWQDKGKKVVPMVNWGEKQTFDIVFRGIPENTTIAFSTQGWKKGGKLETYQEGIDYMVSKLKPKRFLVYGLPIDANYHNVEVIYCQNDNVKRLKRIGKEKEHGQEHSREE